MKSPKSIIFVISSILFFNIWNVVTFLILTESHPACIVGSKKHIGNLNSEANKCIGRSSHWRCSIIKGVLENFTKFTGKHLCWSHFFNKVTSLKPSTLLKKRLQHRFFPVNFAKFLRTPFIYRTPFGDYFFIGICL